MKIRSSPNESQDAKTCVPCSTCFISSLEARESMRRQGVAMPTNSLQFDNDLERELDHVCYTKLLAYLTVQGAKKRQFNSFETHNALAK